MICQNCNSPRLAAVSGKTSDCCFVAFKHSGKELEGYVPYDLGIGGGDYIEFTYCLDCLQIQGTFPISEPEE